MENLKTYKIFEAYSKKPIKATLTDIEKKEMLSLLKVLTKVSVPSYETILEYILNKKIDIIGNSMSTSYSSPQGVAATYDEPGYYDRGYEEMTSRVFITVKKDIIDSNLDKQQLSDEETVAIANAVRVSYSPEDANKDSVGCYKMMFELEWTIEFDEDVSKEYDDDGYPYTIVSRDDKEITYCSLNKYVVRGNDIIKIDDNDINDKDITDMLDDVTDTLKDSIE